MKENMSQEDLEIKSRCARAAEEYVKSVGLDSFVFSVHRQSDGGFCCHVYCKGCRCGSDVFLPSGVNFYDFISDLTCLLVDTLFLEDL